MRWRYECLRHLMGENSELLEMLSELRQGVNLRGGLDPRGLWTLRRLADGLSVMVEQLNELADGGHAGLYDSLQRLEGELAAAMESLPARRRAPLVMDMLQADRSHILSVGGKAANLGEVAELLPEMVPPGFVVTTEGFFKLLEAGGLGCRLRALAAEIGAGGGELGAVSARITNLVRNSELPGEIETAIVDGAGKLAGGGPEGWAVRSSAVGEDGAVSFAGQFETLLNIPTAGLPAAYLNVVAGRFSERALSYGRRLKLHHADAPMAVLVQRLVNARSAGVLYTRNPQPDSGGELLVTSTWGMGSGLVGGTAEADVITVDRADFGRVEIRAVPHKSRYFAPKRGGGLEQCEQDASRIAAASLSPEEASNLAAVGLQLERHFGSPQDIEWAIDREGRIWILQSRPLRIPGIFRDDLEELPDAEKLVDGGVTIFPGRVSGRVALVRSADDYRRVSAGDILVVGQARPEIGRVIHLVAGVIAESGLPTSHAATLVRERGVPALFEVPGAMEAFDGVPEASLDSGGRRVYLGILWPEKRRETPAVATGGGEGGGDPLSRLVFNLNLTDPQAADFSPKECRSLHDIIRYVHEKAVEAAFDIGDRAARGRGRSAKKMTTDVPLNLLVLDLGGAVAAAAAREREVNPGEINSTPFQALWRGVTHTGISWAGRRTVGLKGFGSVLTATMGDVGRPLRRLGDLNYLIVAPDYMNFNARLAYHYATIDAMVADSAAANFVNFRFRGGGAGSQRRHLRARFLTDILLRCNFTVDRRGDLVTAWLRGHNRELSEDGLEQLGRLMGCARQLDMLLDSPNVVGYFVERFLAGDYQAFA